MVANKSAPDDANEMPPLHRQHEDIINPETERFHRRHGISLILSACQKLKLHDCGPCAATIFHRYFQRVSFSHMDVWSAAMASLLLAIKTQELNATAKDIIQTFNCIYNRRISLLSENTNYLLDSRIAVHPVAARMSLSDKISFLDSLPNISPFSPTYNDWYDSLVKSEHDILSQLGFSLFWIPTQQPHQIVNVCRQRLTAIHPTFWECALELCNDTLWLDLCGRYPAPVIAGAVLVRASSIMQTTSVLDDSWWLSFLNDHSVSQNDVFDVVEKLTKEDDEQLAQDNMLASIGFVRPLVKNCFNDIGSFVWEMFTGRIESDDDS